MYSYTDHFQNIGTAKDPQGFYEITRDKFAPYVAHINQGQNRAGPQSKFFGANAVRKETFALIDFYEQDELIRQQRKMQRHLLLMDGGSLTVQQNLSFVLKGKNPADRNHPSIAGLETLHHPTQSPSDEQLNLVAAEVIKQFKSGYESDISGQLRADLIEAREQLKHIINYANMQYAEIVQAFINVQDSDQLTPKEIAARKAELKAKLEALPAIIANGYEERDQYYPGLRQLNRGVHHAELREEIKNVIEKLEKLHRHSVDVLEEKVLSVDAVSTALRDLNPSIINQGKSDSKYNENADKIYAFYQDVLNSQKYQQKLKAVLKDLNLHQAAWDPPREADAYDKLTALRKEAIEEAYKKYQEEIKRQFDAVRHSAHKDPRNTYNELAKKNWEYQYLNNYLPYIQKNTNRVQVATQGAVDFSPLEEAERIRLASHDGFFSSGSYIDLEKTKGADVGVLIIKLPSTNSLWLNITETEKTAGEKILTGIGTFLSNPLKLPVRALNYGAKTFRNYIEYKTLNEEFDRITDAYVANIAHQLSKEEYDPSAPPFRVYIAVGDEAPAATRQFAKALSDKLAEIPGVTPVANVKLPDEAKKGRFSSKPDGYHEAKKRAVQNATGGSPQDVTDNVESHRAPSSDQPALSVRNVSGPRGSRT